VQRSWELRRNLTNESRRQVLIEQETPSHPGACGDPAFAICRVGKDREHIVGGERRELRHDLLERFYAGHGITIERILTDNGGCYRSRAFAIACDELGIGHRWTRPYRPQTNGKAERLVRTLLTEWAYAEPFTEPDARVASLARFIDFYNRHRPHWSLAGQPPISRVPVNNLTGKNS